MRSLLHICLTNKCRLNWRLCTILLIFIPLVFYNIRNSQEISKVPVIQNKSAASSLSNLTYMHIHSYDYPLLLSPINACQEKDNISALIIVCSSTHNNDARLAIRNTWSSEASSLGVGVYFIVGESSSAEINNRIRNESRKFGDIIQYGFKDAYKNLTIKSIHVLKWALDNCKASSYVMKVDDDVFVNLRNLVYFINNRTKEIQAYMFGLGIQGVPAIRDKQSKYFVPLSEYPSPTYPPYLNGPSYFMSRKIIPVLYQNCIKLPYLRIEDVFITGICRLKSNFKLKDIMEIGLWSSQSKPLSYSMFLRQIATHRASVNEMYDVWRFVSKQDNFKY